MKAPRGKVGSDVVVEPIDDLEPRHLLFAFAQQTTALRWQASLFAVRYAVSADRATALMSVRALELQFAMFPPLAKLAQDLFPFHAQKGRRQLALHARNVLHSVAKGAYEVEMPGGAQQDLCKRFAEGYVEHGDASCLFVAATMGTLRALLDDGVFVLENCK